MTHIETQFKNRKDFVRFCSPYEPEAYAFLLEAVDHCLKKLKVKRHVSGAELLEGIRDYGMLQFGPMVKEVFNHWGIRRTDDFGVIVFRLIDIGLLSRSETDSQEDFNNVYDFNEVFGRG